VAVFPNIGLTLCLLSGSLQEYAAGAGGIDIGSDGDSIHSMIEPVDSHSRRDVSLPGTC